MHPPYWTQVLGYNVKHNVFLIVTLENGFLFMNASVMVKGNPLSKLILF